MKRNIAIVFLTLTFFGLSAEFATAALFWGRIGATWPCVCQGGREYMIGKFGPLLFVAPRVYQRGNVAPGKNALGRYSPGGACTNPVCKGACCPNVPQPTGTLVQIATS